MFNRDPIIPAELADNKRIADAKGMQTEANVRAVDDPDMDFDEKVEYLEGIKELAMSKARKNNSKATATQVRYYNIRHASEAYKVGDKVMKSNMAAKGRKSRVGINAWIGPYEIVTITEYGSYVLKRDGRVARRAIPPQQVKRYYQGLNVCYDDEFSDDEADFATPKSSLTTSGQAQRQRKKVSSSQPKTQSQATTSKATNSQQATASQPSNRSQGTLC
jgi:hypothetical protein